MIIYLWVAFCLVLTTVGASGAIHIQNRWPLTNRLLYTWGGFVLMTFIGIFGLISILPVVVMGDA